MLAQISTDIQWESAVEALKKVGLLFDLVFKRAPDGAQIFHKLASLGMIAQFDCIVRLTDVSLKTVENLCHYAAIRDKDHFLFNLKTKYGLNLEKRDPDQRNTPLHVACHSSSYKTINYLLFEGCRVNTVNTNNSTPLLALIRAFEGKHSNKFKETIKMLTARGADIFLENDFGESPVSCLKNKIKGTEEDAINLLVQSKTRLPYMSLIVTLLCSVLVMFCLKDGLPLISPIFHGISLICCNKHEYNYSWNLLNP